VLHLQARVHFEEVKILVLVHQKFDRPRVDVIHCLRGFHRHTAHLFAQFIIHEWRRRFLHQLLVTALN
jgi:hypothetical protein